jgi:NAD+ diphosphatase
MENSESAIDNLSVDNVFERVYPPISIPTEPALWFLLQDKKLLVQEQNQSIELLQGDDSLLANIKHQPIIYIGKLNGQPCLACDIDPEQTLPANWKAVGLRELYGSIPDIKYNIVTYASQLINWLEISRYCPVCGVPMTVIEKSWGKQCPTGHYSVYPPVIPAVIVLIQDGERIFLGHKRGWGNRYSLIAGFVEPGETLEECVHREIKEETGLEVKDIKYISSQPWPFPSQLMVGFTAQYKGGVFQPQDDELDDARWFTRETLPGLPPPVSVAYLLIHTWLNQRKEL